MNLTRIRSMIAKGDISKQALRYLLECRGECEYLDFKERLDLSDDRSKANFAKDAIAMKNTGGGYIVVGVKDKSWNLVGSGTQPQIDTKLIKDAITRCLWTKQLGYYQYRRDILLNPVNFEACGFQMVTNCLHECRKVLARMVVTDRISCEFPHMFLWIQLRTAGREVLGLNVRMLAQIVAYGCSLMPFRPIP